MQRSLTKTIFILSTCLLVFLPAVSTFAAPEVLPGLHGKMMSRDLVAKHLDGPNLEKARRVRVDCDLGRSLQRAVDRPRAADDTLLIEFRGTCFEGVLIERDDVILRGLDESAKIVGQVGVKGASRVRLEDFIVSETPAESPVLDRDGDGIRVVASNRVIFDGITVTDAGGRGMSIEGSSIEIIDTSILRSRGINFIALGSWVVFTGHIVSEDSPINGFCIINAASVFVNPGSLIEVLRNPIGVFIEEQGVMTLAVGARISARENSGHGIMVIGQGALLYASSTIESRDNGWFGIAVVDLSHFTPFTASEPEVMLSGNGQGGLLVARNSVVVLQTGTTVLDNVGFGIVVEESNLWASGVVASGNNPDVAYGWGAKVSLPGPNEFATTPVCMDPSALVRGGECASPPAGSSVVQTGPINAWEGIPAEVLEAMALSR